MLCANLETLAAQCHAGEPRPQRALQRAVFHDPRQLAHTSLVRIELEHGAWVVAEDAHRFDAGQALGRDLLPYAQRAKKLDVAGTERVDPRIEARGARALRCGRDERDRQPVERAHQARADRPAAHYREVEGSHRSSARMRFAPKNWRARA